MSVVSGDSPERQVLVARVKNILLRPKLEWPVIDVEPATIKGLYVGYACILAAIPVICGLIGGQLFGHGAFGIDYRPPLIAGVANAIVTYVLNLGMIFLLALVIDALAPSFDGTKNKLQAFKVAIYGCTASWVAGVFAILPALGILVLLGGLYSLYLLYLGLPVLMKAPENKALGYTVVTIIVAVVLSIAVSAVIGALGGLAILGGGSAFNVGSNAGTVGGKVSVPGVGSVDLDKLQAASKQMEAAGQQMQANASGVTVSGAVQPVGGDVLQTLLPGSIAGYARGEVSSSTSGAAGLSVAEAEGQYARGDQRITLKVTDMGGVAGIASMAGAFGAQSSHTTPTGYQKFGKVGGRLTTEEWDNSSKTGNYSVMVADRFMVGADGQGASMDELKGAVTSVNFARLEGLAH
ncbi:MAG: hypothetical protein BGN86_15080 [Caulobacterales bacterium 68-7]|nr:MAG: hypothetical protein BGN86_15080 [Caulobacterales bacterium 68-7]